jgi:hypothetical protein
MPIASTAMPATTAATIASAKVGEVKKEEEDGDGSSEEDGIKKKGCQ